MSVNRRVDQICNEFEACWIEKDRPSLFDFLKRANEEDQTILLQELLALDIKHRAGSAIPVVAEEYAVFGQEAVRLAKKMIAEQQSSEGVADISVHSDAELVQETQSIQLVPRACVESTIIEEGLNKSSPPSWQKGLEPIAGYTVVKRLGAGAFGEVWEARAAGGVPTALKRVDFKENSRLGDTEFNALELLKRVRHPHLLSIQGFWVVNSTLIIACELADESLQSVASEDATRVPVEQILRYLQDAAEALDYLGRPIHMIDNVRVRILHSDVKPANLLLQGGAIKVADFGLATPLKSLIEERPFSGTPAFSPPEFFEGKVAATSDQYSLAVTYYQLRTGRRPFNGSVAEIAAGHLSGKPNLEGLSASEQKIVLRALARNPDLRWDSCTKFIGELQRNCLTLPSGSFGAQEFTDTPTVIYRGRTITSGMFFAGEDLIPVPLTKTEVKVIVLGGIAEVKITQVFVNQARWHVDARYVFPLPVDAAVNEMRMVVDSRIIDSEVHEVGDARELYESSRDSLRGVTLVEQTSPGIFTTLVANIDPNQEIRVELTYLQSVPFLGGMYRLHVPIVVSKARARTEAGGESPSTGIDTEPVICTDPDLLREDTIAIDVELDTGVPLCGVDSPTHDIRSESVEETSRVHIQLRSSQEIPNRDFVLTYRVRGQGVEHALFYEPEQNGEPGTFMLLTTPPATISEYSQPCRIIFVLGGQDLENAKRITLLMLETLKAEDQFNIVPCDSRLSPLSNCLLQATPDHVTQGLAFVESLSVTETRGTQEIDDSLRTAFRQLQSKQSESYVDRTRVTLKRIWNRLRTPAEIPQRPVLCFLNGGFPAQSVTAERDLLMKISPEAEGSRVVAIAVGRVQNNSLMTGLSRIGQGFMVSIDPAGNRGQGREAIQHVLKRLRKPAITNVKLKYDKDTCSNLLPSRLAEIDCEVPMQIVGRFHGKVPPRMTLTGTANGSPYRYDISPEQIIRKSSGSSLCSFWARQKIAELMEEFWQQPNEQNRLRQEVIELAKRHRLASDFTSFVAVEKRPPITFEYGEFPTEYYHYSKPVYIWDHQGSTRDSIVSVNTTSGQQSGENALAEQTQDSSGELLDQILKATEGMVQPDSDAVKYLLRESLSNGLSRKLDRVRKPRVHITYNVEAGGASAVRELPLVLGVIGDFAPSNEVRATPFFDRSFLSIDRDNFDDVMNQLRVTLSLSMPSLKGVTGVPHRVVLNFACLQDFEPARIIARVEPLTTLLKQRSTLNDLCTQGLDSKVTQQTLSSPPEHCRLLFAQIFSPQPASEEHFTRIIMETITNCDDMLVNQLHQIAHHPEFLRLEGTWRGLHYLVMNAETGRSLKIRMLNVSKQELLRDLCESADLSNSQFYRIFSPEFEISGGQPYAALIGDFEFSQSAEDVRLLSRIAMICEDAFCLFMSAAFLPDIERTRLTDPSCPANDALQSFSDRHSEWNTFRRTPSARFVSLLMPRILARAPYQSTRPLSDPLLTIEPQLIAAKFVNSIDSQNLCWMNTAYVFALQLSQSFERTGQFHAVCGLEYGGRVSIFPTSNQHFVAQDFQVADQLESQIIGDQSAVLAAAGFMSLTHDVNSDTLFFSKAPSCHKPTVGNETSQAKDAELSASLACMLTVSRFAHFIRCIVRDKFSSHADATEIQDSLNRWISSYISTEVDPSEGASMRSPLAAADIEVRRSGESARAMEVSLRIKPHVPNGILHEMLQYTVHIRRSTH